MTKFLPTVLALVCCFSASSQTFNAGFEEGSLSGWQPAYGQVAADVVAGQKIFSNETAGTSADWHIITDRGNDPIIDRYGVKLPTAFWGNHAVRVGNAKLEGQRLKYGAYNKLTRSFLIDQNNSLFQYAFAIVLNDPKNEHYPVETPAFSLKILANGEQLDCGFYEVSSGKDVPGFTRVDNELIYREWTVGTIDLKNYIGKTITIDIITHDCTRNGHWGYAYFDTQFIKPEIKRAAFCGADSTVVLTAPEGFSSYTWNTSETTRSINVKYSASKEYFVDVKSFSRSNADCGLRLDYVPEPLAESKGNLTICEGEPFTFGGNSYTSVKDEIRILSVKRDNLCDSLVTITLKTLPKESSVREFLICQNDSYSFAGRQLTDAGQYFAVIKSSKGCDSSATVNLKVEPLPASVKQVSICEGKSYPYEGVSYTVSGDYKKLVKRPGKCDSVAILRLTVIPLARQSVITSICFGETFAIGDTMVKTAGIYTNRIRRPGKCDSIVTAEITVIPLTEYRHTVKICTDEFFSVAGNRYTTSGTYLDRFKRPGLCDSLVYTTVEVFDKDDGLIDIAKLYRVKLGDSLLVDGTPSMARQLSYSWYLNDTLFADSAKILFYPQRDTDLTVYVNKGLSCAFIRESRIQVGMCDIYIPSLFSPNSDNINDGYAAYGGKCITQVEGIYLYNRLGQVVYKAPELLTWQDGVTLIEQSQFEKLPEGNYQLVLEFLLINQERSKVVRTVSLKR